MEEPPGAAPSVDVLGECAWGSPAAGADLPGLDHEAALSSGVGPGELRQDVLVGDRGQGRALGRLRNDITAELGEALASARRFAGASKSRSTIDCYRRDFGLFQTWCEGVEALALPASINTVAAYLAALPATGLKVSTILRRAAAIAYAHRLAGHAPPTSSDSVKAVLQGIRRELGVAPDRKAPVTVAALLELLGQVPPTMGGRRDRALLSVGFGAALRRSELCALKVSDLEFRREGVIIGIPFSKTDQEGEGQTVAVPNGVKVRPVQALKHWLEASGITDGPVFRSVNKGGRVLVGALDPGSVARIVKRYAGAAGFDLDDFAGHSLRAGFVTEALENGADLLSVMRVTRHASVKTLQAYDRRAQLFRNHAGAGFL